MSSKNKKPQTLDFSALLKGLNEAGVEFIVKIEFQGNEVYVLNLETIVALKHESKDPKDRYRLPILEETLHQITEENNE